MQQQKRNKSGKPVFLKMYRRFIGGFLYYLREQSPVQSIKYNEKFLKSKSKIEVLENKNFDLQEQIDEIDQRIEDYKSTVAKIDAEIGSVLVDNLETIIKASLGVVTIIVLFQIFGIDLANLSKSWQDKAFLIISLCVVSVAIVFLTSSLIIGAISYINESTWSKKVQITQELGIPNLVTWLFVLACIFVIYVEGFAGGYLASQLIQNTDAQTAQVNIQKTIRQAEITKIEKARDERKQDIKGNEGKVQLFMSILASVNIAWSTVKGIKLKKTRDKRGSRSSFAARVKVLAGKKKRYERAISRNQKEIEKTEKIVANYLEDVEVSEAYTGLSRQNTAGKDYTGQYPPMPNLDDFFGDQIGFDDDNDDFDNKIGDSVYENDIEEDAIDDLPDL